MEYEVTRTDEAVGTTTYSTEDVYNMVENITGDEWEAQAAKDWCELAYPGDRYDREEFAIEVNES